MEHEQTVTEQIGPETTGAEMTGAETTDTAAELLRRLSEAEARRRRAEQTVGLKTEVADTLLRQLLEVSDGYAADLDLAERQRRAALAELEELRSSTAAVIAEQAETVRVLAERLAAVETELDSMRNTKAWRATGPLRAVRARQLKFRRTS